ncbi:MAG: hypothetical protein R2706_08545 [Acidimicrobiales bacterium]
MWAVGDINGRGAFTHTSYHDYEILAANLEGGDRSADARIPTCTRCLPIHRSGGSASPDAGPDLGV